MALSEIYNFIAVNERLFTAGMPTAEQLTAAATAGVTLVINLAAGSSDETLPDEAEITQALGMAYVHIPVVWDNPQPADFAAFETVMRAQVDLPAGGTGKTLIHCVANYRVTAFYSLYALKYLGWTAEQAAAWRAQIWLGRDYPLWETFIAEMTERILVGD